MTPADQGVYEQVQRFYARQMRCLDEGKVVEWAATFTLDGVFAANAHPEPFCGREAIEAGARKAAAQLAADGMQRRHWLGMLEVLDQPDGTLATRSYALIVSTPAGGKPTVHLSTTCDDVLVRDGDELLVRSRQVRRDDLPGQ
jgi:3-phenylpropionate/cinnamic acid dioxygenase small subunit